MSDASLGSGGESVEASSNVEANEGRESTLTCPYCGEVYGCERSRSVCQASHFEGSGSVSRVPDSKSRKKNIVDDWKEGSNYE